MNTKHPIKLKLASRRVMSDEFAVPAQSLVHEPVILSTLEHSPIELGVTLIAAQPFAQPAKPKQQRSRVLARRVSSKHTQH